MPLYDQVELLCQAILALGRQEAERIITKAREEADRLVAAAEARRQKVVQQARGEIEAQARLEARSRIDRAALESKRRIAEAREAMLAEVFKQGLEHLLSFRNTPKYADWLRGALVQAIKELGGDRFRIVAHPEEAQWLILPLLAAVGQETDCQLELEPDSQVSAGGFIAVRADGLVRYDQTVQGIINRQRDSLRTELARKLWGTGMEALSGLEPGS